MYCYVPSRSVIRHRKCDCNGLDSNSIIQNEIGRDGMKQKRHLGLQKTLISLDMDRKVLVSNLGKAIEPRASCPSLPQ